MQVALEDVYHETERAYYVKIKGYGHCILKEEARLDGITLTVPRFTGRSDDGPAFDTKICPAEMARQKNEQNFRLVDVARYWGVSITTVRKAILGSGAEIRKAGSVEVDVKQLLTNPD